MKIRIILLFLFVIPTLALFSIESNEDVCRDKGGEVVDEFCCLPCENSTIANLSSSNLTNSNRSDSEEDNCCPETIDESITCEDNDPPCYIEQDIIFNEFLFEKSLLELVILVVILILVLIFMIYVCCCFGSKKPPVPYEQIVGKYD